jgi:hypothetical protein
MLPISPCQAAVMQAAAPALPPSPTCHLAAPSCPLPSHPLHIPYPPWLARSDPSCLTMRIAYCINHHSACNMWLSIRCDAHTYGKASAIAEKQTAQSWCEAVLLASAVAQVCCRRASPAEWCVASAALQSVSSAVTCWGWHCREACGHLICLLRLPYRGGTSVP